MAEIKINEEKFAQANYIVTLYSEVHQLNVNYCNLINLFLEIGQKNPQNKENPSYSEEDAEKLKNLYINLRFYSMQIYLKLNSLTKQFKISDEKMEAIKLFYDETKKTYDINSEKVEVFLININDVLTQNLLQNLLSSSQDMLNKIYQ